MNRNVEGTDIAFATESERIFGMKFSRLCGRQSEFSQKAFGLDSERGPVGPLRHLATEANEAADKPTDITEYADCLLLLIDASRRAGITPMQLVDAAFAKLEVNKSRKWQKPVSDNQPIEHVR